MSDFAIYLEVSQPSLSQWMRGVGREPNLENLFKLSRRLGVKETFEAAGHEGVYDKIVAVAFNDPDFQFIARTWFDGTLDETDRQRLLSIARGEEPCESVNNDAREESPNRIENNL